MNVVSRTLLIICNGVTGVRGWEGRGREGAGPHIDRVSGPSADYNSPEGLAFPEAVSYNYGALGLIPRDSHTEIDSTDLWLI